MEETTEYGEQGIAPSGDSPAPEVSDDVGGGENRVPQSRVNAIVAERNSAREQLALLQQQNEQLMGFVSRAAPVLERIQDESEPEPEVDPYEDPEVRALKNQNSQLIERLEKLESGFQKDRQSRFEDTIASQIEGAIKNQGYSLASRVETLNYMVNDRSLSAAQAAKMSHEENMKRFDGYRKREAEVAKAKALANPTPVVMPEGKNVRNRKDARQAALDWARRADEADRAAGLL